MSAGFQSAAFVYSMGKRQWLHQAGIETLPCPRGRTADAGKSVGWGCAHGQRYSVLAFEDTQAWQAAPCMPWPLFPPAGVAAMWDAGAGRASGHQLLPTQEWARDARRKGARSGSQSPGYFGLIIAGCAFWGL